MENTQKIPEDLLNMEGIGDLFAHFADSIALLSGQKIDSLGAARKLFKDQQKEIIAAMQSEEIKQYLGKISSDSLNKILNAPHQVLNDGKTIREAINIPKIACEGLYAKAYQLYNQGLYEEATRLFRLLTAIDGLDFNYAFGLAASLHAQEEYFEAIAIYTYAAHLDIKNPLPHFHMTDCFMKQEDYLSASISIGMVTLNQQIDPKYEEIKKSAVELEKIIHQKIIDYRDEEVRGDK